MKTYIFIDYEPPLDVVDAPGRGSGVVFDRRVHISQLLDVPLNDVAYIPEGSFVVRTEETPDDLSCLEALRLSKRELHVQRIREDFWQWPEGT